LSPLEAVEECHEWKALLAITLLDTVHRIEDGTIGQVGHDPVRKPLAWSTSILRMDWGFSHGAAAEADEHGVSWERLLD